jgi:hypothetical protein
MLRKWRKHSYLRLGALLLVGLFVGVVVADAAICQFKTDKNGNCPLTGICCHIIGALNTNPIILLEQVAAHDSAPDNAASRLLSSTIFHPPRA